MKSSGDAKNDARAAGQRSGKGKRKFNGTAIAALIVVALAAYAYFVEFEGGKKKDAQKEKDAIALKFEPEKATRFEIVNKDARLIVEKKADVWRLIAPVEDEADAQAVDGFLKSMAQERSIETIAEGPDFKAAKYGLENPTGKISIKTADGKFHEIKIGAKSFDSNLYAQVDSEAKAILVSSTWDVDIAKQPKDLRDKRLWRAAVISDVDAITIAAKMPAKSGHGERENKTELVKREGAWVFAKPEEDAFPVSQAAVGSFLDSVKGLRAQEFATEDKTDAAVLRKLGLAFADLSVDLRSGQKGAWRLRAAPERQPISDKKTLPVSAESGSMMVVISSDVPAIVQASKTTTQSLFKSSVDFYDRSAPFQFTAADAALLTLKQGGATIEAKKIGEAWRLPDASPGSGAATELDAAKVTRLFDRLAQLRVGDFLAKEHPKGIDPNKNRLTVSDAKGEPLFELAWGESFRPEREAPLAPPPKMNPRSRIPAKPPEAPAGKSAMPDLFVETRIKALKRSPAFGLSKADFDALGLSDLKKAPAPPAAPSSAAAQSAAAPSTVHANRPGSAAPAPAAAAPAKP